MIKKTLDSTSRAAHLSVRSADNINIYYLPNALIGFRLKPKTHQPS
ncbi:hypothetical protein [Alkalimarinus alittae]|uniref:Uncharacterized protein n=1 Tax=Alkalimarinus alittae TaxID=2961619 RepID=A0ABY6N744_9ALTE|nr:hypothetical protein [Alkalimarinus alittae]UZE97911.1 hypothetical protein NKI27_09315 [Alkalimarinus alittae]